MERDCVRGFAIGGEVGMWIYLNCRFFFSGNGIFGSLDFL